MLLKLIDNNSPVSFIINIFILLVAALSYFFLSESAFNGIFILNILSVAATVFVMNIMSDKFHLFKELTYLSSFIFLLLTFNLLPVFFDTVLGFYLLLFVFYLYLVLSVYNQSDAKALVFNAGFTAGLLYLADPHLLIFGLVLFLMLMLSRSFYWREWLLAIIGILLPVFYLKLFSYLKIPLPFIGEFQLSGVSLSLQTAWVFMGSSLLLTLLTLFYLGHKTVRKRNIYTSLLSAVILTLLIFLIYDENQVVYFTFPLTAILATHLYHRLKKQLFRWLVLLFCVALSVVTYFL